MKLIPVTKRMMVIIILFSVLSAIAGAFIVAKPIPFVLGVLLGATISIARVVMLGKAVQKSVTLEPGKARIYATSQYYIRFFMTIAVLIIAAVVPLFNMIGAVFGIFSFNIAAYTSHLFKGKIVGSGAEKIEL